MQVIDLMQLASANGSGAVSLALPFPAVSGPQIQTDPGSASKAEDFGAILYQMKQVQPGVAGQAPVVAEHAETARPAALPDRSEQAGGNILPDRAVQFLPHGNFLPKGSAPINAGGDAEQVRDHDPQLAPQGVDENQGGKGIPASAKATGADALHGQEVMAAQSMPETPVFDPQPIQITLPLEGETALPIALSKQATKPLPRVPQFPAGAVVSGPASARSQSDGQVPSPDSAVPVAVPVRTGLKIEARPGVDRDAALSILAQPVAEPGQIMVVVEADPAEFHRASIQALAAPQPRQIETLIDSLVQARETGRTARGEVVLRHAEFGTVNLQLESGQGDLRVTLASRDPGFVVAAQAALAAGQGADTAGSQQRGQEQAQYSGHPQASTQGRDSGLSGQGDQRGSGSAQPDPRANRYPAMNRTGDGQKGEYAWNGESAGLFA